MKNENVRPRRAGIAPALILIPILMMAVMMPVGLAILGAVLGMLGISLDSNAAPAPAAPQQTIIIRTGKALSEPLTGLTTGTLSTGPVTVTTDPAALDTALETPKTKNPLPVGQTAGAAGGAL